MTPMDTLYERAALLLIAAVAGIGVGLLFIVPLLNGGNRP